MKKELKLNKQNRDISISKIKEYFATQRDESIGDLAAGLLLDHFMKTVAPQFYNQGVLDAIAMMTEKIDEIYTLEIH